MNIYLFTLLAFGTVFFARWAQASSLPRAHAAKTFLSVFLERVADLLLCVAVVSLFLSAVLGVLQIYYWNGINIGSLLAIENAKNWVWGLLDTLLPAPCSSRCWPSRWPLPSPSRQASSGVWEEMV